MKNSRTPPSEVQFAKAVSEAFAFLGNRGFREESHGTSENPVQISFTNDHVRIIVEGTDWGLNARVGFGHASLTGFENYDFDDLLESANVGRRPKRGNVANGSTQLAQVASYASLLRDSFPTLLEGDEKLFEIAAKARAIRELTLPQP